MFHKAERRQAKLRLALCGAAGSGKTYSALLIAQGLVPNGKIAMIDTERGSGELYADLTAYDIAPLQPPYTPDRYIELIRNAQHDHYDILIIDSLSHAWNGEGGILDMHSNVTATSKQNSFFAWNTVTPKHNALIDAIIGADLNVIVTMRTKTAYDIVENNKGKKEPVKIGLAPIQRDGVEYEFTTIMELAVERHIATASKDRTGLFNGQHFIPTVATGIALREWLTAGIEPNTVNQSSLTELLNTVSTIENVTALSDWWRQHSANISDLTMTDRELLRIRCAHHKRTLIDREAMMTVHSNGLDSDMSLNH